jgi:hypothetical protein|eukprot:COSAG03_NODE_1696_length_3635_cov_11.121041_3_plen_68_part_00
MNPVLRFLQDLGKAKTNALSVIVTMRPDPATLRIVSDSPERSLHPDSCARTHRMLCLQTRLLTPVML